MAVEILMECLGGKQGLITALQKEKLNEFILWGEDGKPIGLDRIGIIEKGDLLLIKVADDVAKKIGKLCEGMVVLAEKRPEVVIPPSEGEEELPPEKPNSIYDKVKDSPAIYAIYEKHSPHDKVEFLQNEKGIDLLTEEGEKVPNPKFEKLIEIGKFA